MAAAIDETKAGTPAIGELVSFAQMQERLARVFPGNLQWELRLNRQEYSQAGALFVVAGKLMVHPPTFERTLLAIAARKARA